MRTTIRLGLILGLIFSLLGFSFPVLAAPGDNIPVDVQISSGNDDCVFFWNGSSWDEDGIGFTGLYTGYVDSTDYKEGVALRWASVPVPPGVIVGNCYISLCANNYISANTVNSKITGDKELLAASWNMLADYQSRRGLVVGGPDNNKITTAQVTWNQIGGWQGNQWYNSPDISSIIQEIINQPGWQSGNPIAIFWDDHEGLSTPANGTYRGAYSYDAIKTNAAKLHIEYTPAPNTYYLNINNVGNGAVAGNQYVYHTNDLVSLNATPSDGWSFSGWSSADITINNPLSSQLTFNMPGKNVSVTANFIQNFNVNASVIGGHGTLNPVSQIVNNGNSALPITFTPDPGYHIASITDNSTQMPITNPYQINNVTATHNVVVTFAINTFRISASAGNGGSISPSGDVIVNYGSNPTFSIIPNRSYFISDVKVDGVSAGPVNTLTISNVSANHTVSANFTQNSYSFSVNIIGNGSVSGNRSSYYSGNPVSITSNPASGWTFGGWSGSGINIPDTSANPLNFAMPENPVSLNATFVANINLSVNINPVNSGTVTFSSTGPYSPGAKVTLTAIPALGWTFTNWSGSLTGAANPVEITVSTGQSIAANFTRQVINYGGGGGGGFSPPPSTPKPLALSGLSTTSGLTLDSYSRAQSTAEVKSEDGNLTLDIAKNTILCEANGVPLKNLTAKVVAAPPSPPPPAKSLLLAYELGPEGALFNPAITLSLAYNPRVLPEGTLGESVTLAFWDGSQWVTVDSKIDKEQGKISASISHFSIWGLLATVIPPPKITLGEIQLSQETVKVGESVTLQASLTNSGGSSGKYSATLKINDSRISSQEITLAAGASQTLSFKVSKDTPGSYTLDLNGKTAKLLVTTPPPLVKIEPPAAPGNFEIIPPNPVEASPEAAVTTTAQSNSDSNPLNPLIWGIITVAALIGIIFIIMSRRPKI